MMSTPPQPDKKKPPGAGAPVVPPARRRSYARWLLLGAAALALAVAALAALVANRYGGYIAAPEPALKKEKLVEIAPGMSFKKVTAMLDEQGVISHPYYFLTLARAKGVTTRVQAGEYAFKPGMNPLQILDLITRGDVTVWELMVPEGFTMMEIAGRLAELGPWSSEVFLAIATDPARTGEVGIPIASMEGYLFPAHYPLRLSMTEDEVIENMLTRGLRERTPDRLQRAAELGFSWHQVLTLAAMVQKEAVLDDEMSDIAGVFINRLKLDMKLQCDPTAVYDLTEFTPPIKKEHLQRDSPYNTYLYKGLPPGPICNPGQKAIDASLNPSTAGYLYFVATGAGRHVFSIEYRDHVNNVNKYLKNK